MPGHSDEVKMNFGDHLEELRRRLIYALVALVVTFVVCLFFMKPLMRLAVNPVQFALVKHGYEPKLIVIKPQETFVTHMKVCIIAALFIASPFIMYQIWVFVSAGLYPHERRYVRIFAPFTAIAFIAGGVFCYFVLARWGLSYLIGFGDPELIDQKQDLAHAINFVLMLELAAGIVFQLPLVMLITDRVGLLTAETYRRGRKYAVLVCFAVAMVLTPPDVVSQVLLAGPMLLLYEVGLLLCRLRFKPRETTPEPQEEDDEEENNYL